MSKEVVPDELCDPQVEIMGDIKVKVEHVKLLDLDLTDPVLFPQMPTNAHKYLLGDGSGWNQRNAICAKRRLHQLI
jgi:hypothetical protein